MTYSDLLNRFNALPLSLRTSRLGTSTRHAIFRNNLKSATEGLLALETKKGN